MPSYCKLLRISQQSFIFKKPRGAYDAVVAVRVYEVEPIHQKHSNYKEGKLLDQRGDKDALLLQTLSSRLALNKCHVKFLLIWINRSL